MIIFQKGKDPEIMFGTTEAEAAMMARNFGPTGVNLHLGLSIMPAMEIVQTMDPLSTVETYAVFSGDIIPRDSKAPAIRPQNAFTRVIAMQPETQHHSYRKGGGSFATMLDLPGVEVLSRVLPYVGATHMGGEAETVAYITNGKALVFPGCGDQLDVMSDYAQAFADNRGMLELPDPHGDRDEEDEHLLDLAVSLCEHQNVLGGEFAGGRILREGDAIHLATGEVALILPLESGTVTTAIEIRLT